MPRWAHLGLCGGDIGLFCGYIGLFCGYKGLFCAYIRLFCAELELFCEELELFCGPIGFSLSFDERVPSHMEVRGQQAAWGSFADDKRFFEDIQGFIVIQGSFADF